MVGSNLWVGCVLRTIPLWVGCVLRTKAQISTALESKSSDLDVFDQAGQLPPRSQSLTIWTPADTFVVPEKMLRYLLLDYQVF
jgi:hypothetical protein